MGAYCYFSCLTCGDGVKYDDKAEFKKHLIEKHGYLEGTPGSRSMVAHIDGQGWHETWFEWDFDTFKFREENGWKRQDTRSCSVCGAPGRYLCDYPLAPGKTCDKPLCGRCRVIKGPDQDWCPGH